MSPNPSTSRLVATIGISILAHVHIALVVIAVLSLHPEGCAVAPADLPIEVSLEPTESTKSQIKPEDLDKAVEEEQKKEKETPGQVVDIAPPREEQRPDSARFRSEYDSKVAKETKGPPVPFKRGRLLPNRPVPAPRQSQPPSAAQERQLERKVMKLAMRTKPELPRSELERDLEKGDEPRREPRREQGPVGPEAQQQQPAPQRRLSMKDLQLTEQEVARALGTRANDALEDIEEGEDTLLNSKRWRFASFFNRVKRQVAENWHPDEAYRRRDPQGNVYGFRDRLTILRVKLDPAGRLKDVRLERGCGVPFLDDEAIAAFRAAEPFPNPPRGLVDKSGWIRFRFGFLFEISRGPGLRIFRFQ